MNPERPRIVGTNAPRVGVRERLTGDARFVADHHMEGALHAAVVRSERPHAEITDIDPSEAKQIKGFTAFFTADDIPGTNRLGIINKDQRLLADGKVRCVGDPIALVVAETVEAAEQARDLVRVRYRDLPAVFDPEEALRQGAPEIHEGGNRQAHRVIARGNPEAAFETADVIVERVYTTTHVEHTYLEPDAGAAFVHDDGRIVVYASTQNPHYDRKDIATLLDLDEDRVRVIQCFTGGGFGSKLDMNVQGFVALAAFHLKRPVRMTYSREEAFLATGKRHPLTMTYKTGATRDGRLIAADVRILGDTGAYASYGLAVASRAAVHAIGPYEVPNVYIESTLAYTNNPMAGAMRGFGCPQVAFAHESQMDLIAAELGLSPLEIRQRNTLRIGSLTATGQQLSASVGINQCIEAISDPYHDAIARKPAACSTFSRRGVGIGAMYYGIGNTGVQNPSTAHVELKRDGRAVLYTGAADIGQGSSTVLRQMAAESLGLEYDDVDIVVADTLRTTNAGATSASRQTYISGNAVLDACSKLRDVLCTEAAMMLKADRAGLELADGTVRVSGNPEKSVTLQQIAERAHHTGLPMKWRGFFDPVTSPLDPETGRGMPYATYAFACHVAEVDVDTATGEVTVRRVVAAHDVGRAINPMNVIGQINSGVAMGVGFAIMEEFDPRTTESMKDYHIPCAADMPRVDCIIVEDPEPTGPFGAKGVGEPALIPTAPAILNAVADALGQRVYDLPANLERVLKASLPADSC